MPRPKFSLPANYSGLKVLGNGSFGTVIDCWKEDTQERVAVKLTKRVFVNFHLQNEAAILQKLRPHNLHEFNIGRFIDSFSINLRTGLVYEMLDITLHDYMVGQPQMKLAHIWVIIAQLAVALDALKRIGVIHADLKLGNIMFVDRIGQPFRVKLIDFGSAMFRLEAGKKKNRQPYMCKAPEVLLGLPFSEAIDSWGLGLVMATMLFYVVLFPGNNTYDVLRCMIDLLGPPPDYLLNAVPKSHKYFRKENGQWFFKTPEQYWWLCICSEENRLYTFRSPDVMKKVCLEPDNETETAERSEATELLKAMLQWDDVIRITPGDILSHAFITGSVLNSGSHLKPCSQAQVTSKSITVQVEERNIETPSPDVILGQPLPDFLSTIPVEDGSTDMKKIETLSPDVIMGQPDDDVNTMQVEDIPGDNSNVSLLTITSDKTKKKKKKNWCCCCCANSQVLEILERVKSWSSVP